MKKNQRGFVALFFVLTIASFLTMLIYGLSHSFEYTLILLRDFRVMDNARSSALYCKYKLANNVFLNAEYTPALGVNIATPYGSSCMYESYKKINPQTVEVIIVGKGESQTFTIEYVYMVTDALHGYVQHIEVREI